MHIFKVSPEAADMIKFAIMLAMVFILAMSFLLLPGREDMPDFMKPAKNVSSPKSQPQPVVTSTRAR